MNEAKETIMRFFQHIENSQTASIEGISNYYIPQIPKKDLWRAKQALACLEPKCQTCEGSGEVRCNKCCGDGHLPAGGHSNKCYNCDGKGKVFCADCQPEPAPSTSSGQASGFVREEVVGALLNERVQKELALKDRIEQLEADNKKKDELLFAYESVAMPINPLITENEQLEAEKAKLEKMLQDALPHIECRNDWQSGLISRIGEYFQTLKGDKDVDTKE